MEETNELIYTPTEWKTGDVITAEKLNNNEEMTATLTEMTNSHSYDIDDLFDRTNALSDGVLTLGQTSFPRILFRLSHSFAYCTEATIIYNGSNGDVLVLDPIPLMAALLEYQDITNDERYLSGTDLLVEGYMPIFEGASANKLAVFTLVNGKLVLATDVNGNDLLANINDNSDLREISQYWIAKLLTKEYALSAPLLRVLPHRSGISADRFREPENGYLIYYPVFNYSSQYVDGANKITLLPVTYSASISNDVYVSDETSLPKTCFRYVFNGESLN